MIKSELSGAIVLLKINILLEIYFKKLKNECLNYSHAVPFSKP